jgi:hypothetical protein
VRSLANVGNLRDVERFLRACALRSANLLNKADLARDVGIASSTANHWLRLPLMRTSLALAIASNCSGVAKRVSYPLKAPAALGTMWRTQPSGTGERTNRGFLAQCPPNPQVYPPHKTTRLSRRRCVLPQPAQATEISGSLFLFLFTVEILICASSHEFSN